MKLKCMQLRGCTGATRKLRVTTRTCKCECEIRVNYTRSVNYNSLNMFTETIGFTFIRKYLTSISKLLDFVGFLINQNCDSQDLEDLFALHPLCYKWFLPIATSSLEVLNRMIMEWIFQLKTNQNCGVLPR